MKLPLQRAVVVVRQVDAEADAALSTVVVRIPAYPGHASTRRSVIGPAIATRDNLRIITDGAAGAAYRI